MDQSPTIYLIAGCNGAGKTTFAMEFLPKEVKCLRFLNADEIARGLSPLDPSAGAVKAGRLLLEEFAKAVKKRETFAVESTLSGRTYAGMLRRARKAGYEIELHYLFLATPEQALARVRQRVEKGGHDIPEKDLRRRFWRSRENLLKLYLPFARRWTIWDGRILPPKKLASWKRNSVGFVTRILTHEGYSDQEKNGANRFRGGS
jgi:predicted ABC-type ATPase